MRVLPLPLAGEGWGEGSRSATLRTPLTRRAMRADLSRERER
jgi:hypothetical protein